MITWKRLIISLCVLVVGFGTFINLILPGIVKDKAVEWVADNTGRTLEIGQLSINPVSLVVEISDLRLSNQDQTGRFISWETLRVSLSPRSLYHLAPILSEIRLVRPFVHIERLDAKTFNFSDLIPEPTEQTSRDSEAEPTRFSLNNIMVEDGRIEFLDRSLAEQISHTIRDLDLAVPFLGNLPYLVEEPVQPMFSAIINDSPIEMQGELTPFAETREFSLRLGLSDIDLPYYLAYVPIELPIELRNGRLAFALELLYRAGMKQKPEFLVSGEINLTALDIWDRQNEQLFFLPLLKAQIAPSRPLEQDIHLNSLGIYNLEVNVSRDSNGVWNHSRLQMPPGQETKQEPEQNSPETPSLQLAVDQIRVRDGIVFFRDDLPEGGFSTTAREITIDLKDFSLAPGADINVAATLQTDNQEQVSVGGSMSLTPLSVSLNAQAQNLLPAAYAPYYAQTYTGPLGGTINLQAGIDVNPEQPLLIKEGAIAWQNAYLAFNDKEGMGIEQIDIAGLSFNLAENHLEVGSAIYANGSVNFSRDRQGQWSILSNNFPLLAKLTEAPAEKPVPAKEQAGSEFSYRIGKLAAVDWSFDVHDRLPTSPVHLQASQFNLSFENLAAPQQVESPFEFSTIFDRRGTISVKGTASLAAQTVSLDANIGRIPLAVFAPYVAEQANLELKDGTFDARLKATIKPGSDTFLVNFGGDLGISRFHLLDSIYREDLLKWDSLQIAGIDGNLEPLTLAVESITLSDYFAKVLIDEQARLNLTQVFAQKGQVDGEQAEVDSIPDSAVSPTTPSEAKLPADIRIATVTLQGGQVDFTDRHLPRTFHADMRQLGGSIQGLSSDTTARASVDLRGQLRNQSPLAIEGQVNPLAEKLFLDLKLNFSDIEMSPMSPYSGTYLGYLIKKGKLNLALEYQVEDGELKASNEVFLDQFTFGDPVESDQATGLPVKLAVALLKDRNGEIHLDIPVSGELDDPQFSIAGVVWTVIKNLLVKAATSPLALLGAIIGGGDEDFSSIDFTAGSDQLTATAQEKLDALAKALLARPSLNLEIHGFVDPENDPEGYRQELLHRKIEQVTSSARDQEQAGQQDTPAETVEMTPEEYSDALWEVYKQADFPKPRNFIGMVKHIPDEELEKLIYTNTTVGPEDLAQLAQRRAQAARNYLVDQAGVASERVFLSTPDINQPPEKDGDVRSRVDFDIVVE